MINVDTYKIWLIEDDANVIDAFTIALQSLSGQLAISSAFHDAYEAAVAYRDYGMIFVDNTLTDCEDVGPALVRRIRSLNYSGVLVSNSFGRLKQPILGTDIAFPKDRCRPALVIDFITNNYPRF